MQTRQIDLMLLAEGREIVKLGLITYDCAHLKTEQLVNRYIRDNRIDSIEMFALPYVARKERVIAFPHRPDMTKAVPTESLAQLKKVSFQRWDGRRPLGSLCDVFVIGGAGILDVAFTEGKPVVNGHPGIIPLTRGLDSFKWAIYNGDPLGITLHIIDAGLDEGDILSIEYTPVFTTDSLETLARRHYELEIDMLANVIDVLSQREQPSFDKKPATRRMNAETEAQMVSKFENWKADLLNRNTY